MSRAFAFLIAAFMVAGILLSGCTGQVSPKACTLEAKACPDGSYVGRNASNNCEFNPCPLQGASNGTQIANPASVFCKHKGYELEIRKDPSGGELGYCVFGNGRGCEEWAFFRGECNETAPIIANEGQTCGGVANIPCAGGLICILGGKYPDAGGKCVKPVVSPKFTECPAVRGEICTLEYSPVCGRSGSTPSTYDYEDYPNPCVACSKTSPALVYVSGTCAENNLTSKAKKTDELYDCPASRPGACTEEYDPVCGRVVDATSSASYFRDFPNPCAACASGSNAVAYYVGKCADRKT